MAALEEGSEHLRGALFVEHVGGDDHVEVGRRRVEQAAGDVTDRNVVQFSVERYGGFTHRVDIVGRNFGRARQRRRDADKAGARGEIEHALAANGFGMIDQIARQRLAACPGKRPEGRGDIGCGEILSVASQIGVSSSA